MSGQPATFANSTPAFAAKLLHESSNASPLRDWPRALIVRFSLTDGTIDDNGTCAAGRPNRGRDRQPGLPRLRDSAAGPCSLVLTFVRNMTAFERITRMRQVAAGASGALLGCVAYATAFIATIDTAPRQSENIRQVVDLPWPVFALLPSLLAFVPLLVALVSLPKWTTRMSLILTYSAAVAAISYFGIDLLRRDYIGKF